jgi:hypothetical protein
MRMVAVRKTVALGCADCAKGRGRGALHDVVVEVIISMMAPGTSVYLNTWRGGGTMQVTVVLGSTQCRTCG